MATIEKRKKTQGEKEIKGKQNKKRVRNQRKKNKRWDEIKKLKGGMDEKSMKTKQKGCGEERSKIKGRKTKKQGQINPNGGEGKRKQKKGFTRWRLNLFAPIKFTWPRLMMTKMNSITTRFGCHYRMAFQKHMTTPLPTFCGH